MISVLIITKNEENLIANCLNSAKQIADEIIVLDAESVDKTVEIVKKYTDKIFVRNFIDFSQARNFLLSQAKNDWVFYLDADERITPELADEIKRKISSSEPFSAYALPRKNILLGRLQMKGDWWPDYQIRFFKRRGLKKWEGKLHEKPVFTGQLGYLQEPILHMSHRSIAQMLEKTNKWSEIEAELMIKAYHPKMSSWRFFRVVLSEFIKRFFKLEWLGGTEGTIEYFYQTFSLFISYAKLWEMQRDEKLDETYRKIDDEFSKKVVKSK
ncbi:MAG: glycosyltransferase family 2 protein [Nitrososphaerota archaeon]